MRQKRWAGSGSLGLKGLGYNTAVTDMGVRVGVGEHMQVMVEVGDTVNVLVDGIGVQVKVIVAVGGTGVSVGE